MFDEVERKFEERQTQSGSLLHGILPLALAIESLPLTLGALAVAATTVEPMFAARLRATVAQHWGTPYQVRRRPEIRAAGVASVDRHPAEVLDLSSLLDEVLARLPAVGSTMTRTSSSSHPCPPHEP